MSWNYCEYVWILWLYNIIDVLNVTGGEYYELIKVVPIFYQNKG